ncbi:MAG: hypothetical protein HUK02_07300, partial [Bacteroidaceae bacterium]|nr:hypothetical protein [Bacteroidaceae bacterium]
AKQSKNSFGISGSYSTKKDSSSTQSSRYSVEATMDVRVKAGPDDLPAGVTRLLNELNNSISAHNPYGELTIITQETFLTDGKAEVTVKYLNEEGMYDANAIKCEDATSTVISNDCVKFTFSKAGTYKIIAGSCQQVVTITEPLTASSTATNLLVQKYNDAKKAYQDAAEADKNAKFAEWQAVWDLLSDTERKTLEEPKK